MPGRWRGTGAAARGVPVHEVVAKPVGRGALLVILRRPEGRTPTPDLGVLRGLAGPNTAALIELCHDRAITQALG